MKTKWWKDKDEWIEMFVDALPILTITTGILIGMFIGYLIF